MSANFDVIDCSADQRELLAAAHALPTRPRRDLSGFFDAAREVSGGLPARLLDTLDAFHADGNRQGFVCLRSLPVDEASLPPTPQDVHEDDLDPMRESTLGSKEHVRERRLLDMEAWVALVTMRLGIPVGYAKNRGGAVMQDVYPVPNPQRLTAHNTLYPLTFHTEMAYHAYQPRYLVLGCVRGDHEGTARTLVASRSAIADRLEPADARILASHTVPFHVDLRFRKGEDPTVPLRIFKDDEALRYDQDLIDEAEAGVVGPSLRAFAAAADEGAASLTLRPGDMLVIDNLRTAHSRTAFVPRFDGADRWLCRLFVLDPAGSPSEVSPGDVVPFALRPPESEA
ncbi:MAG TPA: TauD/TfdA family dioxygenase [Actinospica sp.]|jgi:clavaminate synthase/L-asparagine oxygenase|nr:TauD/TfdA family dioxygenase [Actinospica sp.]